SAGAFRVTWPDRTLWLTSPAQADSFGQHLSQITDRNGNSIYINTTPNSRDGNAQLITSISTGPNGTGTKLLSMTYGGRFVQLHSVSDCYSRSVYYQDDTTNLVVNQVSQIVTTGTSNPPMRASYGYLTPQNM